jgi:hypothetical protein
MIRGTEIQDLYKTSFMDKFPYDDCYQLAKKTQQPSADLIPELDFYFSTIAGYSSSATRLQNRSLQELEKAKNVLSKTFFDAYPGLHQYASLITATETPRLYHAMQVAEKLRTSLLDLLASITPS